MVHISQASYDENCIGHPYVNEFVFWFALGIVKVEGHYLTVDGRDSQRDRKQGLLTGGALSNRTIAYYHIDKYCKDNDHTAR
ncbi:hypothetical protein D3C81_1076350 [compost metagenome]